MDPISIAAASGMRARLESLDMLSNNIANASTAGYKVDREFYSLYRDVEADGAVSPVIEKPWTDFSQGVLQITDRPLDLALNGKGFFAVNSPSGTLYTRNGSFQRAPNGDITTGEGYPVRLANGTTLRAPTKESIDVGPDGTVTQGGLQLGKLELVDFKDGGLTKHGISLFRAPEGVKGAAATPDVQQGKLEGSNVGSAESAVRLVGILRQFEILQRTITIGGEMNRRALEDVARVGQ